MIKRALLLLALATPSLSVAAPAYESAAPVALLYDVTTNTYIYEKNADKPILPASLTKMMTVYLAFDLMAQGRLSPDTRFKVTPAIWQQWHSDKGGQGGSSMFLRKGEKLRVEDLLKGIITLSGNDACVTLATGIAGSEPAFAAMMNAKAHELGLQSSHFGTSNGWPDNGETHTTARDLARLATLTLQRFPQDYQHYYGLKEFTWGQGSNGAAIKQANRNPLLGALEGADGLKTGHTNESGYSFTGSAVAKGHRLVEVVAGLPSIKARATESLHLMQWGFAAWRDIGLYAQGDEVATISVNSGSADAVKAGTRENVIVSIPADMNPKAIDADIYVGKESHTPNIGFVQAPVHKGDIVGSMTVTIPSRPSRSYTLYALEDVGAVAAPAPPMAEPKPVNPIVPMQVRILPAPPPKSL
jgi:serine-type D-Ala-D-Ala carboxypeptidase (penicillin-binding protein 5/6)